MKIHKTTSAKGVVTECGLWVQYVYDNVGSLRKEPLGTVQQWGTLLRNGKHACKNCKRTLPGIYAR